MRDFPLHARRSGVALVASAALVLSGCSDGDPDDTRGFAAAPPNGAGEGGSPETGAGARGGAGELVRAGTALPLSDGLLVDYGATGAHYNVDIGVADDGYRISSVLQLDVISGALLPVVSYVADDSTVEFDAALYSPGSDGFRDGTFEFVDVEESVLEDAPAALLGRAVFVNAALFLDPDRDGELEEIGVGSGRLAITTTASGFALSLDVTLVDGTRLTGSYSGTALSIDETD